ncbi:MAG: hypothetical protein LBI85_08780 [Spirochaetaceae bacterium]|nr:hypothetical protein [Spirochaetaceae bacterium]
MFLVFVALIPHFLLGNEFSFAFLRSAWPLAVFLALTLAGLDLFYFLNRRLYSLLEKEDWPALVQFLEGKVITKGRYRDRFVKLLTNSYLVLSDPASVIELENKLSVAKPSLIEANSLVFGIARILGRDYSGAMEFFSPRLDTAKDSGWIRFYRGFAALLKADYETAANDYVVLASESRVPLVTGLSGYFLSEVLKKKLPARSTECLRAAKIARERVTKGLPGRKDWNRETSRSLGEISAAVISKYIGNAGRWLYA